MELCIDHRNQHKLQLYLVYRYLLNLCRLWNILNLCRLWNILNLCRLWNILNLCRLWNILNLCRLWNILNLCRLWNILNLCRLWNILNLCRLWNRIIWLVFSKTITTVNWFITSWNKWNCTFNTTISASYSCILSIVVSGISKRT